MPSLLQTDFKQAVHQCCSEFKTTSLLKSHGFCPKGRHRGAFGVFFAYRSACLASNNESDGWTEFDACNVVGWNGHVEMDKCFFHNDRCDIHAMKCHSRDSQPFVTAAAAVYRLIAETKVYAKNGPQEMPSATVATPATVLLPKRWRLPAGSSYLTRCRLSTTVAAHEITVFYTTLTS